MDTMPEFMKTREAETKVESYQEAIWSKQESVKEFSRELEKGIAKVQELAALGAIPAARRVAKENRQKEFEIVIGKKKIAEWEARLAELS